MHLDGSTRQPGISKGARVEARVRGSFYDLGWFEGVVTEVEPAYLGWPARYRVRVADERSQAWFEGDDIRPSRAEA